MKRHLMGIALICLAVMVAVLSVNTSQVCAEEQSVSIHIQGEAIDSWIEKDGHICVPAGTVTSVGAVSPIDGFSIGQDQEEDIQRLFALIGEAIVIEVAQEDTSDFTGSSYGAYVRIEYTPNGAEPMEFEIWGAYDSPRAMIVSRPLYDFDAGSSYITLESEALKQCLLELCQWRIYRRDILKGTQSISVSYCEPGEYGDFIFVTKIEDEKWIDRFVDAILNADVIGHAYNLPPMIKLEFALENGDVEFAYMRTVPVASLMQVGGQQLELKNGEEKMIEELSPHFK